MNALVREFLGENPTKKDLLIIWGMAILSIGTIGFKNWNELSGLPIWKTVLFLLILVDIFAGAIGNFTLSTQLWYKNKPKKRVVFYFEHLVHIGLLTLAVGHLWFSFGLLLYTIGAGLLVNYTKSLKQQEINASAVICIGLLIFYVALPVPQILIWLPAVLLIKLVMGFSVRRER